MMWEAYQPHEQTKEKETKEMKKKGGKGRGLESQPQTLPGKTHDGKTKKSGGIVNDAPKGLSPFAKRSK